MRDDDRFPSRKPKMVNEKLWFYEYPSRIDLVVQKQGDAWCNTIVKMPMKQLARTVDRWRRWKALKKPQRKDSADGR